MKMHDENDENNKAGQTVLTVLTDEGEKQVKTRGALCVHK